MALSGLLVQYKFTETNNLSVVLANNEQKPIYPTEIVSCSKC